MHISPDLLSTIIELLVVLGIMVLVHEFGHFAAAKLCGVRVETFSIGFGTRLFGIRHGDTDYRLSILPLGGYVKMAGDVPGEAPTGDPGEFNAHPRWQRVVIALAGPVANFILTFFLLLGLALFHNEVEAYRYGPAVADYVPKTSVVAATGLQSGDTVVQFNSKENPTWEDVYSTSLLNLNHAVPFSFVHAGKRTDTTLNLTSKGGPESFDMLKFGLIPRMQEDAMRVSTAAGSVSAGMPGQQAGLQPGDTLLSFNGFTVHSVHALKPYLQDQSGRPEVVQVLRGNQPLTLNVTPVAVDTPDGKAFQIGFLPQNPPVRVQNLSAGPAIAQAARRSVKYASLIVDVIKGMFTHRVSVRSVSGPIGIGQQVHQAFAMPGWNPLLELMAFISVNLGIFNLLPIPILDGGMILFLAIESAIRRDLNQQIKERVYQVAFVCLIAFAAFVIFNDITRLQLFAKP
jgi:regulator of sigma E protease